MFYVIFRAFGRKKVRSEDDIEPEPFLHQTNCNFTIDDISEQLSTVNDVMHQIIENNGIPFMIQKRYNAETELAIKEAHEGKNLVGPFDTVDALWESLNAED